MITFIHHVMVANDKRETEANTKASKIDLNRPWGS